MLLGGLGGGRLSRRVSVMERMGVLKSVVVAYRFELFVVPSAHEVIFFIVFRSTISRPIEDHKCARRVCFTGCASTQQDTKLRVAGRSTTTDALALYPSPHLLKV